MSKLGLALSGGGSKGAYEIGVCMALKKINKKIDIVTGTSIGAINGVFIVQNDLRKALKLWKKISFKTIYKENDFPLDKNMKLPEIYTTYIKNFINDGGTDASKLREVFNKNFNAKKFFKSKIDYGLVTYNLTQNIPVFKEKKYLNKDNIADYVIASASCYPAFKPHIINNEMYIDGGYYDNLPINLAIGMGAEEVIAVDLRAIGLKKSLTDKNIPVTYIIPRNHLSSFLIFDSNSAKQSIRFGYNDTMKTFNKLDGDKLTFKKGQLVKNYNKYNEKYEKNLHKVFNNFKNDLLTKLFKSKLFESFLIKKATYKDFNYIVEKAGLFFGFEESTIYKINTYNKGLLSQLANTEAVDINKTVSKIKRKEIDKLIDSRQIIKYFYDSILEGEITKTTKFIPIFMDELLVAIYLITIKGKYLAL